MDKNENEETVLAIELLEAGVPKDRVKELFRERIHPEDLQDLMDESHLNENKKHISVDPKIKRLVDGMIAPDDFIDPLYQHLIKDPVALSSGNIFDRSSVLDNNGELKFRRCPISGKHLSDSIISLASQKREIEHFKAIRDRNVIEMARKMISSGDYESFHSVLEGVENHIKGLGENYLPLARELVAMWSGVREAAGLMLLAENISSHGHSRACQPIVASGGLQDTAFRIIISAEYFKDQSPRRDEGSGIFLSLYNERDLLVERCKLFDYRTYGNNTKNHHVLGKHDLIVTKSKPGYSYKLEYKASEQGFTMDVQGLMCKILPESSRRQSYKMEDAEGEQGIYMGSIDLKSRAQGLGVLDYDDGRRFVGSFQRGSISDGVVYRGAHVLHTMEEGDWSGRINEGIIEKYPVGMLVYDSSDKSYIRSASSRNRHGESGRSRASAYNDDIESHRTGFNRSNSPKRPDMIDLSIEKMFVSNLPIRGGVSNRGVQKSSLSAFREERKLLEDNYDTSSRCSNAPSKIGLPIDALPAFRGYSKFIDDVDESRSKASVCGRSRGMIDGVDYEERAGGYDGVHPYERSLGVTGIPVSSSGLNDGNGSRLNDDVSTLGDFGEWFTGTKNSVGQKNTRRGQKHNSLNRLHNRNEDADVPSFRSHGNKIDYRELDNDLCFKRDGRSISPSIRSRGKMQNSLELQNRKGSFPTFNRDATSAGSLGPLHEDEESVFKNPSPGNRNQRNIFVESPERSDEDESSHIRHGGSRMGTLFEGQGRDSRDVRNSARSQFSMSSRSAAERPMLLMVDNLSHPTKGGNYKKLVKSGTLQEGVSSIIVSAEKFEDTKGMSRIFLTLYDQHKQVVHRKDLFGSSKVRKSKPYVVLESSDSIISTAKPGYYYQLEYKVIQGFEEKITVSDLICKIYPASRSAPAIEMKDPEGTQGRYRGALDPNGNANGKGIFDYQSGYTFVGDFKKGKFVRGVYFRGTEVRGTMKDRQWDQQQIDKNLIKEFPYDVHFYSRLNKSKKSLLSIETQVDEPETYSVFCCM